jgi:beta-lactamase class A
VSAGRLLHELRDVLDDAGLYGSFLVRDLSTGEEIGIDPDVEFPIASLVKLPLAIAVLTLIADGHLDGAAMIDVAPGQLTTPGTPGLGRFRHPARIAIDDLLYLSVAVSDNSAADALFDLVPPTDVRHRLAPDFASDASTWSSKTGSLLNLRHETGVVEHDDGSRYAVTALTESRVPAAVQPAAEAVMAQVARALHDHLRSG